jgi:hypothetical protein
MVLRGRRETHGDVALGYIVADDESGLEDIANEGIEALIGEGVIVAKLCEGRGDVINGCKVSYVQI